MATSTFDKNFILPKKKAKEFARVMAQTPSARNEKGYTTHLVKESDYKESLKKALG